MLEIYRPAVGYGDGSLWGHFGWGQAGWTYEMPCGLRLVDNSFAAKVRTMDREFSDGAFSWGDEIQDREVIVEGTVDADSRADLLTTLDEMRWRADHPGTRLRVDSGHYINLTRLKEFEDTPPPGFDRSVSDVSMRWQCDDPFWYRDTKEARTYELSGDSLIQLNNGSELGLKPNRHGQHPIIRFTAGLLPMGVVGLRNASDGHLQFRYSDPEFAAGKTVVIDCIEGRCYRGVVNTNRYFEGEFLRLMPGTNWLYYTGGPCTLKVEWRPRWL